MLVVADAGKYESSPDGKTNKAKSFVEKGTNFSVDTKPGSADLNK